VGEAKPGDLGITPWVKVPNGPLKNGLEIGKVRLGRLAKAQTFQVDWQA